MNVLLIRPPRIKQAITLSDFMYSEPLGLEMAYGVIKNDHRVEIFDMMAEDTPLADKLAAFQPDCIAITSLCIDVHAVHDIARQTKAYSSSIFTLVGGTQAYLNPEGFMDPAVDGIFHYTTRDNLLAFYGAKPGSKDIPGVLLRSRDYAKGEVKGRNEYILPDRKSTSKYRDQYSYFGYKPAAIMQISQGCAKACRFCLRWRLEGFDEVDFDRDLVRADLAQIEEETIMLYDNDILGSTARIDHFMDLVEDMGLKKNFIAYASVEGVLANKDQVKRFQSLGLKALLVGYESFSDRDMAYYTKKATTSDNQVAAAFLRNLGIDVWASFMAHPDWSRQDFKAFRRAVKALSPQISSVSPLTPFPNLPLYREYKDRLLYGPDDFEKWSFGQVMIEPSQMSLRMYYFEMLKTNLYINLMMNKTTEMLHRYGFKTLTRLTVGSSKAFVKYVRLMLEA